MVILLNQQAGPAARRDPSLLEEVRAAFAARGCHPVIHPVTGDRIPEAVAQALARNIRVLVVGGGDGTLSAAAHLLAGQRTTILGVLPLGTLNHFAKDLGLPNDWREAVRVVLEGRPAEVDIAEVNGRHFINTCSLGGYTAALRRREARRRYAGQPKWRAMLGAVWATLRRMPRLDLQLAQPGQPPLDLAVSFALASNNRYQDDVAVSGRRPRLDAGELWLYASRARHWSQLLRAALRTWRHGVHQTPEVQFWHGRSFVLTSPRSPIHAALDGEITPLQPPLRFRLWPRALRVLVPPALDH